MDRVVGLFTRDRAIGFQVVFEQPETDHDLDFNTTIADAHEVRDASGRHLAVVTSSYERDGLAHRFVFGIRDGELVALDLQRKKGDEWEKVEPTVFSFAPFDEPPPPDFLGTDDVVLMVRGHCTPARGATERKRAVVVLRSFTSNAGRALTY